MFQINYSPPYFPRRRNVTFAILPFMPYDSIIPQLATHALSLPNEIATFEKKRAGNAGDAISKSESRIIIILSFATRLPFHEFPKIARPLSRIGFETIHLTPTTEIFQWHNATANWQCRHVRKGSQLTTDMAISGNSWKIWFVFVCL